MDALTTEEYLVETFSSDPTDINTTICEKQPVTYFSDPSDTNESRIRKRNTRDLLLEEIGYENYGDKDVFLEGYKRENNIEDIDVIEFKIDIDKPDLINISNLPLAKIKEENSENESYISESYGVEVKIEVDHAYAKTEEVEIHQSDDDNSCLRCGKYINRKPSYISCVKPDKCVVYKCLICIYESETVNDIKKHLFNHKEPAVLRTYQCINCTIEMEAEQARNKKLQLFQCHHCGYKTKSKSDIKKHLVVHKQKDELNMFKCSECSYQSKYKKNLKTHNLRMHFPDKDLKNCESKLKMHQAVHLIRKETTVHKCNDCSFTTKYRQSFARHKKTCKKVFNCQNCQFKTITQKEFRQHQLTHEKKDEKEKDEILLSSEHLYMYKCSECTYQSRHKHNLKRHYLKVHLDREHKNFKCPDCNNHGADMCRMEMHQVETTVYKCDDCTFTTKYSNSFVRHKKTCKKVFSCQCCQFKTNSQKQFRQHNSLEGISRDCKSI